MDAIGAVSVHADLDASECYAEAPIDAPLDDEVASTATSRYLAALDDADACISPTSCTCRAI